MNGRHIILLCVILTLIASFAESASLLAVIRRDCDNNYQNNGRVKRAICSVICLEAKKTLQGDLVQMSHKPSKPWYQFW